MAFTRSTAGPATLANLRPLMDFTAEAARGAGVSEERVPFVELAVEEILVNIINYAHADGAGEMRLTCSARDSDFVVEVRDKGRPFDATVRTPPRLDHPVEKRPVGGLGIHFTKKYTDGLDYAWENGENVLTLTFRLGEEG